MKKNNKGEISLEYILIVILIVIACITAMVWFGNRVGYTINGSKDAVVNTTDRVFNQLNGINGSGGSGGTGSGAGIGGGSNVPEHTHDHNIIVNVVPATCETEGQIMVKCSCGEDQQTYTLPKATSCNIENTLVVDNNLDTVDINQSTKIQVIGNYRINRLTGSGDLCFEFSDPSNILTIGESENTKVPKGYGISTKYYNGTKAEVPMFDPYDGWLNNDWDLASDIQIGQVGASFNSLYGTGTLSRDSGGNYDVVNGLVKTSGINTITYNGDWTYSVEASKDATRVEIELVFDYTEKGNSLEYYIQTGLPCTEINSKVAVSDYNTDTYSSYVLNITPDGSETTAGIYIYNPNNPLNDYRIINIEFK